MGGGSERHTYLAIKGLDKESNEGSYEIDLAIGGDSKILPEDINVIKVEGLKEKIRPLAEIRAFWELYRIIRKGKYHLVHTHQSKAGVLGRMAAAAARTSVIVHTFHGPLFHESLNFIVRWIYILIERFCARFTDWFVSVGEELRDCYLETEIGKPEKYSIIRSGMELNKFHRVLKISQEEIGKVKNDLGIIEGVPVIGMVGRLDPDKGWEYAIEVAEDVIKKHPQARFLFVGEGTHRSKLEKIVQEKELSQSIIFTGYRDDIEKVMMVFDVLILTSLREGLSQVLIQGALLGKPMVSFKVLGVGEMIKENGFVVPLKDAGAVARRVDYLLSDLERAGTIGEKGKKLVTDDWTIETMIGKHNELYSKLLNSKKLSSKNI